MKLCYLRGALCDVALLTAHQKTIERVLSGAYGEHDLEKLRGHEVYSLRLNQRERLLFAVELIRGQSCMIVLDYLPTHDYHKSRFLRSGVLKRYMERHHQQHEGLVDEQITFDPMREVALPHFSRDELHSDDETEHSYLAETLEYYQNNWIELNCEQVGVMQVALPAICSGAAGSGKSCVALSILVSCLNQFLGELSQKEGLADDSLLPIVYVTQSAQLTGLMSDSFRSLPVATAHRDHVQIKTYDELVAFDSGMIKENFVGQAHFNAWYVDYVQYQNRVSRALSQGAVVNIHPAVAYQECRIASGYIQEEYLALSDNQSGLPKETNARLWLYKAFERYLHFLSDEKKISPSFYHFQNKAFFSLGLVDEAQDFSLCQLAQLGMLVKHQQIIYLMDSHQRLNDIRSVRPYLLQHYDIADTSHIQLNLTYRSPMKMVALANALIAFKHRLSGGIGDKHESRSISAVTHDKGLGWVSILDETTLQTDSWLQPHLDKPYCAIVTSAEYLEEAKKLFPQSALVLTPDDIKGLEYDIVITYRLYDKQLLQQIPQRLAELGEREQPQYQPKAGAGDDRFGPLLNRIYTSYTRAIQLLIICEPGVRKENPLLARVKLFADAGALSDVCMTKEVSGSWESQVIAYYHQGNKDLALLLFTSKLSRPKCEFSNFICSHAMSQEPSMKELVAADLCQVAAAVASSSPPKYVSENNAVEVSLIRSVPKRGQEAQLEATVATSAIVVFVPSSPGAPITPSKVTGYIDTCIGQFSEQQLLITLRADGSRFWCDPHIVRLKQYLNQNIEAQKRFCAVLVNNRDIFEAVPLGNFISKFSWDSQFKVKLDSLNSIQAVSEKLQYRDISIQLVHIFANKNNVKMIKKLGLLGADLNKTKADGATAAYIAPQQGYDLLLQILHDFGADLNKAVFDGSTPAFVAAGLGYDSILRTLKSLGADLNKAKIDGATPVFIAAELGHDSALRTLKSLGADLNKAKIDGVTPACIAAELGHDSVLRTLGSLGADLNKGTLCGITPAFVAAQNGHDSVLRILIELKVNMESKFTTTKAELIAFGQGQAGIVRANIERKLLQDNVHDDTHISLSPLDIATIMGHKGIIQILSNLKPCRTGLGFFEPSEPETTVRPGDALACLGQEH